MKNLILSIALMVLMNLVSAQNKSEIVILTKDHPISKHITEKEIHQYQVSLKKGEQLRIAVEQPDVDLVFRLFNSKGKKQRESDDAPPANERINYQAKDDETLLFEIEPFQNGGSGNYKIFIDNLLTAEEAKLYQLKMVKFEVLENYAGVYKTSTGEEFIISPYGENTEEIMLWLVNLSTNETKLLFPLADTLFYYGESSGKEYPMDTKVSFRKNKKTNVEEMVFTKGDKVTSALKTESFKLEQVSFENNGVKLSGQIILPNSKPPYPSIVMVAGSGNGTRYFGPHPIFYAKMGIAVLSFDKRGCYKSKGDWKTASFDDLAMDVVSAVNHLKTRKDIDLKQIGVSGISQGGWISTIAANKSDDISFMLTLCGSGVSVWENVVYENTGNFKYAKLNEEDMKAATELSHKIDSMASKGESYEKIQQELSVAKGKPYYYMIYPGFLLKTNYSWEWFKLNGKYDSYNYLKTEKSKVLWLLGENDWNVPCETSKKRLTEALQLAGNTNFTIKTFPKANHPFLECEIGHRYEYRNCKKFVDGFWSTLEDWIKSNIVVNK